MNPTKWHKLDIATLAAFELPSLVCQDCRAISRTVFHCVNCQGPNVIELNAGMRVMDRYRHAVQFAVAVPLRQRVYNAAGSVADVISYAELYIHFATYSIDAHVLNLLDGALRRGVQVAGLVGKANSHGRELSKLNQSYPHLCNIRVSPDKESNPPHQKILIVDGCVAITGSMNLTMAGFQKHEMNPPREFLWAFTDVDSVIAINNEYIATAYYQHRSVGELAYEEYFKDELDEIELISCGASVFRNMTAVVSMNPKVRQFYRRCDRKAMVRAVLGRLQKPGPFDLAGLDFSARRKIYNFSLLAQSKGIGYILVSFKFNEIFDCITVTHKRLSVGSKVHQAIQDIANATLGSFSKRDFVLVEQRKSKSTKI